MTIVARNGKEKVPDHVVDKSKGEVAIYGYGRSKEEGFHAEPNVIKFIQELNNRKLKTWDGDWVIKEGGVANHSNSVCNGICKPILEDFGLTVNGNKFWNTGS